MALPKRRHSSARQAKRRTHIKTEKPSISICPDCRLPASPHRVCPNCGMYKGKKVVEVNKKKEKKR